MQRILLPLLITGIGIQPKTIFAQSTPNKAKQCLSVFYTQQYGRSTPEKAIAEKQLKTGLFMHNIALKSGTDYTL